MVSGLAQMISQLPPELRAPAMIETDGKVSELLAKRRNSRSHQNSAPPRVRNRKRRHSLGVHGYHPSQSQGAGERAKSSKGQQRDEVHCLVHHLTVELLRSNGRGMAKAGDV